MTLKLTVNKQKNETGEGREGGEQRHREDEGWW